MKKLNLYWTDMHSNIHSNQIDELSMWYEQARELIDFWPIAYYPYYMRKHETGMPVEDIYSKEIIESDWEIVRSFVKEKNNVEKDFPMFMGYEWQGAGLDGDHNVFYLENDEAIHTPLRYEELISVIPLNKAIAIPHHLAYSLGDRGKNWDTHNENYSPFAEIYSSHGSSEQATTEIHMTRHIHMGPRAGGTSVFDGLKRGEKVGIIASGDNHVVPAMHGHGLMACYAEELTKEAIWTAFLKRHVYGVTSNKIKLKYTLNDYIMGDTAKTKLPYKNVVEVEGGDAIHRIEILRNNLVLADYTHSGKWEEEELKGLVKFKFKVEYGWGPDLRLYTDIKDKNWNCAVETEGKILDIEKCWTSYGQKITKLEEKRCEFSLLTKQSSQSGKWMGPAPVTSEGFIFEMEADINSKVVFEVDNNKYIYTVRELLGETKLIGLIDEARKLAKDTFGLEDYYRSDPFWHNAYKFKIHCASPEQAYKVKFVYDVNEKKTENDYFMVKVYQRDGNVAWSSPIWIEETV